jgi:hypothetical protein
MFCSWIEKKCVQQLILDMKRATDSEVRVQQCQARVVIAEHKTAYVPVDQPTVIHYYLYKVPLIILKFLASRAKTGTFADGTEVQWCRM